MRVKKFLYLLLFFLSFSGLSQTFSGIVLDEKTNAPIESASIYFDNTTIGTITNSEGKFSISYTESTQSSLVISFIGYKTETIQNYRQKNNTTIYLKQAVNALDEVVVNADDGLTRKQKLRLFRKQFLGFSKFAKSSKILNEDDIIIRYHKKEKLLTATAKAPIQVENKGLQYLVSYNMTLFELKLAYIEEKNNIFKIRSLRFAGNTYYQNLQDFNQKKAQKNREKAFNGSVLQFMRALYDEALEEKDYHIYYKKFRANPWTHFKIEHQANTSLKRVLLDKPLAILYNKKEQSRIEFLNPAILLDKYGNYADVTKVMFSGEMGSQRVGDLLPFNYGLDN